jgi:hypothetical protein
MIAATKSVRRRKILRLVGSETEASNGRRDTQESEDLKIATRSSSRTAKKRIHQIIDLVDSRGGKE